MWHLRRRKTFVFAVVVMAITHLFVAPTRAQEQADTLKYRFVPLSQEQVDSLLPPELRQPQAIDTVATSDVEQPLPGIFSSVLGRQNKFTTYLDNLAAGNRDRSFDKKFDVSFIVMPSYTREGSFGIGGGATGLYRLDRNDSIMQPSDITLIGNITLNGLFTLTANGNIHFPGRRLRYSYKLEYTYSPLDFWGITRQACGLNDKIKYTRNQLKYNSDLVYRVAGNFNVGAVLDFTYAEITKIDNIDYLEGQDKSHFFTGLGITFQYDTRDFILQPRRGMNLMLRLVARPQVFSTYDRSLGNLSLTYNYYQPLWKGGLLALDFYGSLNSMESPWPLREYLGSGGIRMRGYYAGRYVDNDFLSLQAELRQNIIPRLGVAVWSGAGNVFPSPGSFRGRDILYNGGIGLRIELKHNVNGRIDFGFGKHTKGFVFAIGEAF